MLRMSEIQTLKTVTYKGFGLVEVWDEKLKLSLKLQSHYSGVLLDFGLRCGDFGSFIL